MMSKADFKHLQNEVRMLAMVIGLRPAARAMDLDEDRVRMWSSRGKWNISAVRPAPTGPSSTLSIPGFVKSPSVTEGYQAIANVMSQMAERTKLAMARTSQRAFEHCDTLKDKDLHDMPTAIALEKHGRNAVVAHAWNQPQANVAVQVNVPLPTEADRETMRNLDRKLDSFAKLLSDKASLSS